MSGKDIIQIVIQRLEERIRENVKTNNAQYELNGKVPDESEGFMRGITWCREMIRGEQKKVTSK